MPHPVPDLEQIRTNQLRDLKNLRPEADVSSDSDHFVRSTVSSSSIEGLYEHQTWIYRQIFADTADPEVLEKHAATRGLRLKAATPASGSAQLSGAPDQTLQIGATITVQDGRQYITTAGAIVDESGVAVVDVQALIAGIAGNNDAPLNGTIVDAPDGIDSTVVLSIMVGGTDKETHAALLERYLDLIQRPPAGGNKHDYRRWALEVPGVTHAYSYPLRRGLGTIDVAVTADGGLPSPETVAAVQDYIDSQRPVTAKNFVAIAPDEVLIDIEVEVVLSGITLPQAQAAVEAALQAQFNQIIPGQTWVRSHSEAIISAVSGIEDRRIVTPLVNQEPTVDGTTVQWLRLGVVTVELMA